MSPNRAYFRPARASDKAAVLLFTRHTWEQGDYIGMVWTDWINDTRGKLLVATVNRQSVAVAHLAMLSPTEAWLEGVRVDPEYRRLGLATGLTRHCISQAVQLGAGVLRFTTSSTNTPIHSLSDELGFKRTVIVRTYQALPAESSNQPLIRATSGDLPELLRFISKSQMLKNTGCLFGSGWQFLTLDQTQLEAKLTTGKIVLIRHSAEIRAMAILEKREHDNTLVICYADGSKSALVNILAGIRQFASSNKLSMISTWLPADDATIPVFEGAV
jgi:ribosomal protein S18 acetylase RimI-like enzyme